jgi:hypothetical protein
MLNGQFMTVEEINNPITQSQFEQVRKVYETIIALPWFFNSEDTRQDCADLVMRRYRLGITDPEKLLAECIEEARSRFEVK